DAYHALLKMPWWDAIGLIILAYLVLNVIFALIYRVVGGVANASTFLDTFFFSVQTIGTIGYGTMFPVTRMANLIVACESFTGLLSTGAAPGLIFVFFPKPGGGFLFSKCAVIPGREGVPPLMTGREKEGRNAIYDAEMQLILVPPRRTAEGQPFYQF